MLLAKPAFLLGILLTVLSSGAQAAELAFSDMRLEAKGLHSARYLFPEGRRQSPEIRTLFHGPGQGNEYPGIKIHFRSAQSWSHDYLAFDVQNEESDNISLCVGINQDQIGAIDQTFLAGCFTVLAGSKAQALIPLKEGGAYGLEGSLGGWVLPRKWRDALIREQVRSIGIVMNKPHKTVRLRLSKFRLLSGISFDGLVDAYGQAAKDQWPGKVRSMDDWTAARRAEERAFLAWPDTWSRYGGDAAGPKLEATGHFRTQKSASRWQLVDPDGYRFFSIGMNSVSWGHWTSIEDRRALFESIPAAALGDHHGKQAANFYLANLARLGEGRLQDWAERAGRRLRTWGVNTLGAWKEDAMQLRSPLPYTEILHLLEAANEDPAVPKFQAGSIWFPDVFDPAFERMAEQRMSGSTLKKRGEDPFLIGLFSDNEIHWTGDEPLERYVIARAILKMKDGEPAKKAAVDLLRKRYPSLLALNQAWGTKYPGRRLGELEARSLVLPKRTSERLKADLEELTGLFASQYFFTIRSALSRALPDKLFLGARFEKKNTPRTVVINAAPFVDVLSFNRYERRLDPAEWDWVAALDKPVLFTEFHFGATDRGLFQGGLVTVADQEARGLSYTQYAQSALGLPFCVGVHWFKYLDQPVTGRTMDGENYNCGFVSVTDVAYPEITRWASGWNRSVYERMSE